MTPKERYSQALEMVEEINSQIGDFIDSEEENDLFRQLEWWTKELQRAEFEIEMEQEKHGRFRGTPTTPRIKQKSNGDQVKRIIFQPSEPLGIITTMTQIKPASELLNIAQLAQTQLSLEFSKKVDDILANIIERCLKAASDGKTKTNVAHVIINRCPQKTYLDDSFPQKAYFSLQLYNQNLPTEAGEAVIERLGDAGYTAKLDSKYIIVSWGQTVSKASTTKHTIWVVEHQVNDGKWIRSEMACFPKEAYSASHKGRELTGENGFLSKEIGIKMLELIRTVKVKHHGGPNDVAFRDWPLRLVKYTVTKTFEVEEE